MGKPVYLDSNVFMYAAGKEHPYKRKCIKLLERSAAGEIEAYTSAETFQEIMYRYFALGRREDGLELCRQGMQVCEVLPVSASDLQTALDLCGKYKELNARDAIHAAVMLNREITVIYSADKDFDRIRELKRQAIG